MSFGGLNKYIDAAAEIGRNPTSKHQIQPLSAVWRMSRLTRDGTAEPVSQDQILRRVRGQGNIYFPCSADHEQDWQPYPVDLYSAICDDHTCIRESVGAQKCELRRRRWMGKSLAEAAKGWTEEFSGKAGQHANAQAITNSGGTKPPRLNRRPMTTKATE